MLNSLTPTLLSFVFVTCSAGCQSMFAASPAPERPPLDTFRGEEQPIGGITGDTATPAYPISNAGDYKQARSIPTSAAPFAAALKFISQPSNTVLSITIAPAVQVAVESSSGKIVPTATNPVTITVVSGSGLAGTLSAVPVDGVATFSNLSISKKGTYSLVASSPNLSSATSNSFVISPPISTVTETAVAADSIVDSVGINVHLTYTDTAYSDFSNVESGLLALGIRHVRDGLIATPPQYYVQEHNKLGALGIGSIFIASVGETAALFQAYPGIMNQCFEGYENPNEYDNAGIANWEPPLMSELQLLSQAVRGKLSPPTYPVIAPSLVQASSFSTLGNVSQHVDYGNLHNYPGGRNPGNNGWGGGDAEGNAYGSTAWNLDLLKIDAPGLPFMTTETGYTNDLTVFGSVPQSVSAVYMPRLILEQWRAGFTRTYLYEMVSEGGEDFGLYTSNWTPKPAFYAVSRMLNLLTDKGVAFTPGKLTYGISGGDSNLHHLLMQKRDGSFWMALWLEETSYNVNTKALATVTPEHVTLQLPEGSQVLSYLWSNTGNVTPGTFPAGNPISLSITDKLLVLEIRQ